MQHIQAGMTELNEAEKWAKERLDIKSGRKELYPGIPMPLVKLIWRL
jgi:hypothetical protein